MRVLEVAGRPSMAVCTALLGALGAEIVRAEPATAEEPHAALIAGKIRVRASSSADLRDLTEGIDAIVCASGTADTIGQVGGVLCAISAFGTDVPPGPVPADDEFALQAWGGLMAATGEAGGPPQAVGLPVIETFTGINAATAILAACRSRDPHDPPCRIDVTLASSNASLLGTFLAHARAGKMSGYRDGCRHPICAPWNAYPARDGRIVICSSSDQHWSSLTELMGRPELASAPRFADMAARSKHVDDVDAVVGAWTAQMLVEEAVASLLARNIPAGSIRSLDDLPNDGDLFGRVALPDGRHSEIVTPPLRLDRALLPAATRVHPIQPAEAAAREFPNGSEPIGPTRPGPPLTNIRVVEIGPFTAGPLAGRLLAGLGACVVKVEPPGGEVSRRWTPRFGGESGYFANYNAGKHSVAIDLGSDAGRAEFELLIGKADVLIQNLKAGALGRLGLGPSDVLRRHPRLIYCSISGFGAEGPKSPALDTVIQAASGVMSWTGGDEGSPCKAGFSIGDLMAGHLAPLAILAALRDRDRTGQGQHVDVSMLHGLVWLAQFGTAEAGFCLRASDGWVHAQTDRKSLSGLTDDRAPDLDRPSLVERLRGRGIHATSVRDVGDVLADPILVRSGMLEFGQGEDAVAALGAPYGYGGGAGLRVPALDGGRARISRDWAVALSPAGAA